MFMADPRARSIWRWGGVIAALLMAQSLLVAGLFWWLATEAHVREAEAEFAADCSRYAAMPPARRTREIEETLARDIHRHRFLALFDRDGRLVDGNVARMPAGAPNSRSAKRSLTPTRLPGKTSDIARMAVCPMPDGHRLLTGIDLDDAEHANEVVERSLLLSIIPALLLAITFGMIAGRRAARQVDAVRRLTGRIMAGNLRERLPVSARPDSFGLLCAHINAMLDRIEQLVAELHGVGDDIAHQMRTPLTRLRARVERAMGEAAGPSAFRTASDEALGEIDKLLGVVAALLRIRELEDNARRSHFADVDLRRIVEDACDLHGPSAEDAAVRLSCHCDLDLSIRGDADLLMEAVSNLIDNAVKFGPPNGAVDVALGLENDFPVITVSDEGSGVGTAELALVTQRFYRGRHDRDGAGLGLALVKAIADLHGFALRFEQDRSAVSLVCTSGRPRSSISAASAGRTGHGSAQDRTSWF